MFVVIRQPKQLGEEFAVWGPFTLEGTATDLADLKRKEEPSARWSVSPLHQPEDCYCEAINNGVLCGVCDP